MKNGLLLACVSLLLRCGNMACRSFLSGRLGEAGMGLYQLILTVYGVFALLIGAGLSVTITRLVTDFLAVGQPRKALRAASGGLLFSTLIGIAAGAGLYISAPFWGSVFIGDSRSVHALQILALGLPFLGPSALVRGYFAAQRKMLRSCGEQLIEQTAECALCIGLFSLLSPQSTEEAAACTAWAVTAAEILSCVYSMAVFLPDRARLLRLSAQEPQEKASFLSAAAGIWLPCTANAVLRSGLGAVEQRLIPSGLTARCGSRAEAMESYGLVYAFAMPVILFPSVLIAPFAALIIPELSEAAVRKQRSGIRHMSEELFRLVLLYALPVMVGLWFFAPEISCFLYGSDKAAPMIRLLCPVIPLMYVDTAVDGMLKGLDRQTSYFLCNLLDSAVRVLLTLWLVPLCGLMGVVLVIWASEALNTLLSIRKLRQVTGMKLKLLQTFVCPLFCSAVLCALLRALPLPAWSQLLLFSCGSGSVTLHPGLGVCPQTPRSGLTVNENAKSLAKEGKVLLGPFQRLAESLGVLRRARNPFADR